MITSLVLIAGVGIFDYLTGYEISFSLFYLLPISLATWFAGRRLGVLASIASALTWLIADISPGHPYSHPAIYYWNTAIRFSFFIILTYLLSAVRKAHELEKGLARIDNLTGAANGRYFAELLQLEIARSQRHNLPFTVAYVDVDNFKTINDTFGHSMGDQVLQITIKHVKTRLRNIDVVARLGGDEFAFLFPATDQSAARAAISRIQMSLLSEMCQRNWPVTFSIGVLTCTNTPDTADELIKLADALMYSAKNDGKNSIRYSVYAG